jgi:Xaa-Pro dipeptidase
MNFASAAQMAVDWKQRIDFARLRADQLARAKASLGASEPGALLLFAPSARRLESRSSRGSSLGRVQDRVVIITAKQVGQAACEAIAAEGGSRGCRPR